MIITVPDCIRCSGQHRLETTPLKTPRGRHSHWTMCPTNGEPILVEILPDGAPLPAGTTEAKALLP